MIYLHEEKISDYQAVLFLSGALMGVSIVANPASEAGPDAWLAVLIGISIGFLLYLLMASIYYLNPGKSLVGILIACFGKTAGKWIGFLYVLWLIPLTTAAQKTFGYYEVSTELTRTPLPFVLICFIFVSAFAVKLGLEAMGRISEVFLILFFVFTLITLFGFFTNFHTGIFKPVLAHGFAKPVIAGLRLGMLPFGESVFALTVFPNLANQKSVFKVAKLTLLSAGSLYAVAMLRNFTVSGVGTAARFFFPSQKVFRLMPGIDIYPLLDFIVIILGVLKICLFLYVTISILGEIFSFKNPKVLILPIIGIIIPLSNIISVNIFEIILNTTPVIFIFIPFSVLLPAAMLIISLVKRQEGAAAR